MGCRAPIGGQAVIEGVMMRGPALVSTAVREPSGEISVQTEKVATLAERYPILKRPLLRGAVALWESMVLGMKSLSYSAQRAGEEGEEMTTKDIVISVVLALVVATLLFVVLPTTAAKYLYAASFDPIKLNLAEGGLRMLVFLSYVYGISQMKSIRRVFQYHGAEHKTIHAYEAGEELTVENVQKHSTLHPRCGTAFLLIVMLVSIFVFAFLGWPDLWLRILSRILLMPVVAGVSYEIIRFAGRSKNSLVRAAILPGLWLQKLTTRQPDDSQVEVAIRALQEVRPATEEIKVV